MEPAGLTLGVVGLAAQLAKATMVCYTIFDDMSDVGTTYDSILHKLRTEGLRLKGWEEAWELGSDVRQGRLNPEDYRYRYATATLARIVAAFASIDKLQAKYGIVVKKANVTDKSSLNLEPEVPKPRWRNRLSVSLPFRSRSKSPLRNTNTQLVIPTIHEDDLHLLENPRVLGNQQLLPGLPEEISSMTEAMDRIQQSLPMYRRLRWVVVDKAKLDDLLRSLTSLNDGLFQVLPIPAKSPVSTLKLSFEIPFLPNIDIRGSSVFVGREYLLENLEQEIEEGKQTRNMIVLYGTGGMGKTQLALEYIHQHYKEYSSVFWINAASDQTTILGFTQIIQRLIDHHAQISEDYAQIGRLLGMAGKLDSNGCFAVAQPSEAQYVVGAVKRWLAFPENSNWLLVFDNLDDPDLVDIGEYLPAGNHGTVVITSRRRDLKQGRRGFEVQQMQPREGIQLLLTASGMSKFDDLVPIGESNLKLSIISIFWRNHMMRYP